MKVKWYIDDSCCNNKVLHTTDVPDDELEQCNSQEDREILIDKYVSEDFYSEAAYCIESYA